MKGFAGLRLRFVVSWSLSLIPPGKGKVGVYKTVGMVLGTVLLDVKGRYSNLMPAYSESCNLAGSIDFLELSP